MRQVLSVSVRLRPSGSSCPVPSVQEVAAPPELAKVTLTAVPATNVCSASPVMAGAAKPGAFLSELEQAASVKATKTIANGAGRAILVSQADRVRCPAWGEAEFFTWALRAFCKPRVTALWQAARTDESINLLFIVKSNNTK